MESHLHYTIRPYVMHEGHFTITYNTVQSIGTACWNITCALYTAKNVNRRAGKETMWRVITSNTPVKYHNAPLQQLRMKHRQYVCMLRNSKGVTFIATKNYCGQIGRHYRNGIITDRPEWNSDETCLWTGQNALLKLYIWVYDRMNYR
jgi:hypothetical protein